MQEPQGHKLNRPSAEVKPVPATELQQKLTNLMQLIESSQDSIGLVESEIQLAADEIRDRVSHFPKVFVDRFHQKLSEAQAVSDVELAIRNLNQGIEKADETYRSIPRLPFMLINWWQFHPQSTPIAVIAIAAFITSVLTVSGLFIGDQNGSFIKNSGVSDNSPTRTR